MKKRIILFVMLLFNFSFLLACSLDVSMINQDPYPAVPGDYVKLVFQMTGTADPTCGIISFELLEQYPISFDPGDSPEIQIKGGTYNKEYSSYLIAPYKVRVDPDALDGENKIEVRYGTKDLLSSYTTKLFNLEVENSIADFEIYVKDYDYNTQIMTLEILNIADVDVEALAIELPQQENMEVHGAKTNIVGDLDSNEYTTAEFKGIPKSGQITVKISYSDSINKRRTLEKIILFEPAYFLAKGDTGKNSWYIYLILILFFGGVIYYFFRRSKKRKERRMKRRGEARLA